MRIRILWLILLTMAVTALPVSARSAAANIKQDKKTPTVQDGQQDSQKKDEQPKVRIAPNVDLWDGGSARTLAGSGVPISIPAILDGDVGVRLAPTESWPHAPNFTYFPPACEQRSWLTSRYAHAPPLV